VTGRLPGSSVGCRLSACVLYYRLLEAAWSWIVRRLFSPSPFSVFFFTVFFLGPGYCVLRDPSTLLFWAFLDLLGTFHSGHGRCTLSGVLCIRCIGSASIGAFPNKGVPTAPGVFLFKDAGVALLPVFGALHVFIGVSAFSRWRAAQIRTSASSTPGAFSFTAFGRWRCGGAGVVSSPVSLFRGDCNCGRCLC
jgi:hypothetical protein